ncbi:acylphosphatase [Patescibacteria group bacterium]|nr:acylphosphatase [Patescibacteria group bacterium]
MKKRLECIVFGRVQLVMFRDFAQRRASRLGLAGTVKNLKDGSVFVTAEGEEEKLSLLLEDLKKGPVLARVDRLEEKWLPETSEFSDFKILYEK